MDLPVSPRMRFRYCGFRWLNACSSNRLTVPGEERGMDGGVGGRRMGMWSGKDGRVMLKRSTSG